LTTALHNKNSKYIYKKKGILYESPKYHSTEFRYVFVTWRYSTVPIVNVVSSGAWIL